MSTRDVAAARKTVIILVVSLSIGVSLVFLAEAERARLNWWQFTLSPLRWIELPGIVFGSVVLGGGFPPSNSGDSALEVIFSVIFYATIMFLCFRSVFSPDPLGANYVTPLRRSWLIRIGVTCLSAGIMLRAAAPFILRRFKFVVSDDPSVPIGLGDLLRGAVDLAVLSGALLTAPGLIVVLGRRLRAAWAQRAVRAHRAETPGPSPQ